MKVAIVVPSLERKGPVFVAANIANNIVDSSTSVDILYFKDAEFPVEVINKVNLKKIKIKDLLSLNYYDVVHSHSFLPDLIIGFISLLNFRKKYKTVTTIHNKLYDDVTMEYGSIKRYVLLAFWPLAWRLFDKLVFITKSSRNYYFQRSSWIRKKKTNVVYNGVDDCYLYDHETKTIDSMEKIKTNGKIILGTCSVLTKRKGLSTAIEALTYLDECYVLVIVGDGSEKDSLKEVARKNDVISRVIFYKKTNKPIDFMKYFNVYLMTSISEGFGLAAVEASCMGIPVVASNIDTFREIFSNSNSLYFDLGDSKGLAEAVCKLNGSDIGSFKDYFREKFSSKSMGRHYFNIYSEII